MDGVMTHSPPWCQPHEPKPQQQEENVERTWIQSCSPHYSLNLAKFRLTLAATSVCLCVRGVNPGVSMPGLQRVLKGILTYNKAVRPQMVQQFQAIRDKPEPKAVLFTCMDSRLIITRLLGADVGEMFVLRNAGNIIPHNKLFGKESVSTEPGALEFGVLHNDSRHVFVCGHSDCKAMHALYNLDHQPSDSALAMWLQRHASSSLTKFEHLMHLGSSHPLTFRAETKEKEIKAYIDPENQFEPVDKLSQVNTLQQLQNIASYPFLKEKLASGDLKLHAMWFDIYTGDFHVFSREQSRFVEMDEANVKQYEKEIKNW